MVLFNKKFDYFIHDVKIDTNGNYLATDLTFEEKRFTLCTDYGPNNDHDVYISLRDFCTVCDLLNYTV